MSRIIVRIAAILAVLVVPFAFAGVANAAPAGGWGPVIACESGGQNIMNKVDPQHSTAQGFFQITNTTWTGHGGKQFAPTAMGATFAQQQIVAERILATQGISAWGPSASCRSRHAGTAVKLASTTTSHTTVHQHRRHHHRS